MISKEMYRKMRHYTPEIDPTTNSTVILSSTMLGIVSSELLGNHYLATIRASSAAVYIGYTSNLTTTNGYEMGVGETLNLMIQDKLWARVNNQNSGKLKSIVWD
jgi:hypothetical protein